MLVVIVMQARALHQHVVPSCQPGLYLALSFSLFLVFVRVLARKTATAGSMDALASC